MPRIEATSYRIARYRSLMTQVSDERALQALRELCAELEARAEAAAPAQLQLDPEGAD